MATVKGKGSRKAVPTISQDTGLDLRPLVN